MSDTLNIRVTTDLTDRQNNILREEKSAGRQAYFHNGRLCYRERRFPPPQPPLLQQDLESSPSRCRRCLSIQTTTGAQQERSNRRPSHSLTLRHGRVPDAAQTDDRGRSLQQTRFTGSSGDSRDSTMTNSHPPQGVLCGQETCRQAVPRT